MKFLFVFLLFLNPLYSLTLEEKVGQLLMVHFNGNEVNEEAKQLMEECHVGGFIFFNWANGLETPEEVKKLCEGLQSLSKIPLWLAVDQEGGPVARLKWLSFPGNRALSQHSLEEAQELATELASELKALGINMNLAPVVDISSNPEASYMTKRTFGDTPEVVIKYAKAVLEGMKKGGIVAVLKHFPGYGDVVVDPHANLPILHKSIEEMEKVELMPYKALENDTEAIMTAHILVPALDESHCATISRKWIQGVLREQLDFQGLVVTDSLVMEGLLKNCGSIEEAAIQAVLAGCDLLILGGTAIVGSTEHELSLERNVKVFKALVEAVKTGRIPQERLDDAVFKNISLKERT